MGVLAVATCLQFLQIQTQTEVVQDTPLSKGPRQRPVRQYQSDRAGSQRRRSFIWASGGDGTQWRRHFHPGHISKPQDVCLCVCLSTWFPTVTFSKVKSVVLYYQKLFNSVCVAFSLSAGICVSSLFVIPVQLYVCLFVIMIVALVRFRYDIKFRTASPDEEHVSGRHVT